MRREKTVYALTGAALLSAGIATAANAAPADYKPLAEYYANRLVVGADHLQDAIQSGDRDAAKTAWNAMRPAYERCESFSGAFFPEFDAAIDQHPVGKPAEAGAHAISPILFRDGDLDKAIPLVKGLKKHATEFRSEVQSIDFDAQTLMNGLTSIAHELGHAKMKDPESPTSGTSLRDYRGNMIGIEETYALAFRPEAKKADAALDKAITADISRLSHTLAAADDYDGIDKATARKQSDQLVADLQKAAQTLDLNRASLD